MKTRPFPKDSYSVSEIGLGCWQLGANWSHVEESTARNILQSSYDHGVNFFDTADVYGAGRSETIIGKFLQEIGNGNIFVATKIGRKDLYPDQYTESNVRTCVEDSLRRLGVDCLDLVQTHCIPDAVMRDGAIYQWLTTLKKDGKIRSFGASVESMDEALMLIDTQPDLYSLQIIFNIFRQKPIDTLFEKAREAGVGIIARVPLASGVLTGKFKTDTSFGESDHRNFNKDGQAFNVGETFAGVPFETAVTFANQIAALKPEGMTLTQMGLRWIIDHPAVTTVIPGASRPEQAVSNAAVSDISPLSPDTHNALQNIYYDKIQSEIRGPY